MCVCVCVCVYGGGGGSGGYAHMFNIHVVGFIGRLHPERVRENCHDRSNFKGNQNTPYS